MKTCSKCSIEKEDGEFYSRPSRAKMPGQPKRLMSWCKRCRNAHVQRWHSAERKAKPAEVREYYRKIRIKHRDAARIAIDRWRRANLPKVAARLARYRAAKLQATPAWANAFFIREIYDLADRRTNATDVRWEVDHIIPLVSKKVCGLHVETNLQVIPRTINRHKSNQHWPDMLLQKQPPRLRFFLQELGIETR